LIFKRKISGVAGASCFVSGDDERSGAAMAMAVGVAVADGRTGGSWGWGGKAEGREGLGRRLRRRRVPACRAPRGGPGRAGKEYGPIMET